MYVCAMMELLPYYMVFIGLILQAVNPITAVNNPQYKIKEEEPPGYFIGDLIPQAGLDNKYDMEEISKLRFRFLSEPKDTKYIKVEENRGILRINHKIDREKICPLKPRCLLEYDVVVHPSEFFEIIKVTIEIMDINDHSPEFPESRITLGIPESTIPGTTFTVPAAKDPDGGDHGIHGYQLDSDSHMFTLKMKQIAEGRMDVRVMLVDHLDRETLDKYHLKIIATDGGKPKKSGTLDVDIEILDSNDNGPKFDHSSYEVIVPENKAPGSVIITVHATDRDLGLNGQIVYSFTRDTRHEFGHIFDIHPTSGDIFIKGELNFEEGSMYILTVNAHDKGHGSLMSQTTVIVKVTDLNDKSPEVSINTISESGVAELQENSRIGTFVAHLLVKDEDTGSGGIFSCNISSTHFKLDKINPMEYHILSKVVFDREMKHKYEFAVICNDEGMPPQRSVTNIGVRITDVNDHSPRFKTDSYSVSTRENRPAGSVIANVTATDLDAGRNARLTYRLSENAQEYLRIDDKSGVITTGILLDYERLSYLDFYVTAEDKGVPPHTATAAVFLKIINEDDEMPSFTQDKYTFRVNEARSPGEIGFVTATDPDSIPKDEFVYKFDRKRSVPSVFEINQQFGIIRTKIMLDREKQRAYHLVVVAHPIGNPSQTCSCSIVVHVDDFNDNPPVFDYPAMNLNDTVIVSSRAQAGFRITTLQAHDPDEGINADLMYKIVGGDLNRFFTMDSSTGDLFLYKQVSKQVGKTFALKIEVTDKGDPQQSAVTNLYVSISNSVEYSAVNKPGLSFLASDTLTIILSCTAGALLVLILIAVVAIVCVREHRRDRSPHIVIHDTKETEKMLPPPQPEINGGPGVLGYNGTSCPVKNNGLTTVIDMREAKVVGNNANHQKSKNTMDYLPDRTLQKNGSPKHNGYVKDYLTFGKPPNDQQHHLHQQQQQHHQMYPQHSPQRLYNSRNPSPINENHRDYANKRNLNDIGTRTSTVSGEYVHYDAVDSDIL